MATCVCKQREMCLHENSQNQKWLKCCACGRFLSSFCFVNVFGVIFQKYSLQFFYDVIVLSRKMLFGLLPVVFHVVLPPLSFIVFLVVSSVIPTFFHIVPPFGQRAEIPLPKVGTCKWIENTWDILKVFISVIMNIYNEY